MKRWFETSVRVYSQDWTKHSRENPRGSGFCDDQGVTITLRRRVWIFGIRVWDQVLDSEEMPSWAWINSAVLGSSDWRSRLHDDKRVTKVKNDV